MDMNDGGDPTQTLATIREAMDGIDLSARRVSNSLNRAFSDAIVRGKSFEDVLRGLGMRLSSLALEAALKPVTQGIGSMLSGAFGAMSAQVTPFAEGGIVSAPTFFGHAGGVGLMGERGAEAIMPLARGPDGRLGIASTAQARTASVNITISTPDIDGFRRNEGAIAATLARAVARGQRNF